jgi:hypothetical protein
LRVIADADLARKSAQNLCKILSHGLARGLLVFDGDVEGDKALRGRKEGGMGLLIWILTVYLTGLLVWALVLVEKSLMENVRKHIRSARS